MKSIEQEKNVSDTQKTKDKIDVKETVESYISKNDWRVKENSNVGYSISGLQKNTASKILGNYTLNEIYPKEISDAHRNGDLHIHDLSFGIGPYCAGWSLQDLLREGFNGVEGKIQSGPAKHFDTALLQMMNFIGTLQNEWAGAQSFNSMDSLLAPFVSEDNLSYEEVKQGMQKFVFNLNVTSRWAGQTPFSNLTFDWTIPEDLADQPIMIGGELKESVYSDYKDEQDMINKAFMEVMMEGDKDGRPFSVTGDTRIVVWENNKLVSKEIRDLFEEAEGGGKVRKLNKSIVSTSEMNSEIVEAEQIIKHKHEGHILKISTDKKKTIKISPGHSVFTVNEEQEVVPIKGSELRRGDIIVTVNNIDLPEPEKDNLITYNDYERVWKEGVRGCTSKTSRNEIKMSRNLAWLYGYFVGDGYKNEHGISFSPASEEEGYEIIRRMKKEFDVLPSYIRDDWSEIMYKRKNMRDIFSVNVEEENKKKIPKCVWRGNDEIRTEFWKGLFKADGTKGTGVFKQADNELLRELRLFLLTLGKTSSLNNKQEEKNERNYILVGEDDRVSNNHWEHVNAHRVGSKKYERYKRAHSKGVDEYAKSDLSVNVVTDIEKVEFSGFLYDITSNGKFVNEDGVLLHNTFPIPTYNITDDFNWNSDKADMLFDMTAKYGLPYFTNFIGNKDSSPQDIRSMCCRLQLSVDELKKNVTGGLFGSSDKTGSLGVVTINMPKLAYLSNSKDEFFQKINEKMILAKQSLEIKREIVEENMQRGLLPYSKRYLGTLDMHFSTIGLVGMNEACHYLLNGKFLITDEGKNLAIETLKFMRKKLEEFQEETGNIYNLEATPAEGTCYRLAKKDKENLPDMFRNLPLHMQNLRGDDVYYTNSTQLPVYETGDLFGEVEHQEPLQQLYTGGTVFHAFIGEKMSRTGARTLIKKIITNSKLPYVTLTPTYSICDNHGYMAGEHAECPSCGESCEVYSRVVGYYRPVKNWNRGKTKEYLQRKEFEI